ncbi:MAG: LytTR family DNA-binding domain-containing protein [Bacteroidales bacterium]|jgi:two-component system LytT family response regulator
MIKAVIVENDRLHAKSLADMIEDYFDNVQLLDIFDNVPSAALHIPALNPDLLFLDIELGAQSGFDLLDQLKKRDFEVIFTTAYQQYAIQAIKMSALDYLEKPIDPEQLKNAMARYSHKIRSNNIENLLQNFSREKELQKIALYDGSSFLFVSLSHILRLQSDNAYTLFYFKDNDKVNKMLVSRNLAYYEDLFEGRASFYRVHNQHFVNINYIKRLVHDKGFTIIMEGDETSTVPVARARRDGFIRYLRKNGILI